MDLVETTKVLAPLALWLHQVSPGVGLVKEGALHRELERIYGERGHEDPAQATRRFLEDVRGHAALLLDRGGRQYGFIHLTFQEYLAAVALAQRGQQGVEPIVKELAAHMGEAPWHEVSLLTIGYLGIVQQWDEVASALVEQLLEKAPGTPGEAVVLVGQAVVEAGPGGVTASCRKKVVEALLETMQAAGRVTAVRRAEAGRVLADLGDPRLDVTTVDAMEFFVVRAGSFLMGDERQKHDLPYEYQIGRFPVTVAQFREFVESSGQKPEDPDSLRGTANAPVVWVSWREAVAFCRWLTRRWQQAGRLAGGWEVSLPSEEAWEKAARGVDGRIFPWGSEADPDRANYDDAAIGRVSSVGCFPTGKSLCGCEEMSGNVWEWTRSLWEADRSKRKKESSGLLRVLRGGSYFDYSGDVRCAVRNRGVPDYRYDNVGFRVVLLPFSSDL